MKYTIGVDIGTTNLCALLVDSSNSEVKHVASEKNDTLIKSSDPACFEQDAAAIIKKTLGLINKLVGDNHVDAGEITGIAITGQMHGVVLVDGELKPQTPLYTWRDRRAETSGVLTEITEKLSSDYIARTGCRLSTGFGGVTLAWLLRGTDDSKELTSYTALTIADLLAGVLTGKMRTDFSNAASWGVFDIHSSSWCVDILSDLGIPVGMLPEVVSSGKVVGHVLPEMASIANLTTSTKVWVPVGDNQASYFGATKAQKNVAVINIGTSGQLTLPTNSICIENGVETRPIPGGEYIWVGATLCGGWSYEYLARFFADVIARLGGVDIDMDQIYDKMKALLAEVSDNRGSGLSVDTRFSGTRSGLGVQSGSIVGIDEGNLTAGNMIYSFLKGIVEELAGMLPESSEVSGWDRLIATGNAIRLNPGLLPIIEDVFGKKCELSDITEEAASGAALIAIKLGE